MLTEEGQRNLFHQIHTLWIEPEIRQREAAGTLPQAFRLARCLIRLPRTSPPIVQFNDEIGWTVQVKTPSGRPWEVGEPVALDEIQRIETVDLPEVEGIRVAFVYLFMLAGQYRIIFDFMPNGPVVNQGSDSAGQGNVEKHLAESLEAMLVERTVQIHDSVQRELQRIGLWAAPALLPYPLSRIVRLVKEGKLPDASRLLVSFCTPEFLTQLAAKWWTAPEFAIRRKLLEEALYAHTHGHFHLSILASLPQIEGVITDWVYTQLPSEEVPWRQESKTKKFKDLLAAVPTDSTMRRIMESALEFVLAGPVLATFKNWFEQIDQSFVNRHVAEHGRYDSQLYSEENSLKVFLLLDTIHHLIGRGNAQSVSC